MREPHNGGQRSEWEQCNAAGDCIERSCMDVWYLYCLLKSLKVYVTYNSYPLISDYKDFCRSHLQAQSCELAVPPWGKLERYTGREWFFHLFFFLWASHSHPFFIWNPASGNFIIMGGDYNEGSWSCRLIGFFTSTGPDLSRPWAANLHIWSWGQDKRGWGKKRVSS